MSHSRLGVDEGDAVDCFVAFDSCVGALILLLIAGCEYIRH